MQKITWEVFQANAIEDWIETPENSNVMWRARAEKLKAALELVMASTHPYREDGEPTFKGHVIDACNEALDWGDGVDKLLAEAASDMSPKTTLLTLEDINELETLYGNAPSLGDCEWK